MDTRRASDALTAAMAFLWYAAPDLMPDRTSKIACRAGLLIGGSVAVGFLERDALAAQAHVEVPADSEAALSRPAPAQPVARDVVAIVGSGIAVDLVMRRLSRRRREAGKRFAHLPSAVLAAGYSLAVTPWMHRVEARLDAANRLGG